MRAGWNRRLAELLQRPDPAARAIVEGVVYEAEDVRLRREQWATLSGDVASIELLEDGSVQLKSTTATPIAEVTASDGFLTDFQPDDGIFEAGMITWPRGNPDRRINQVRLHLVAQRDPGQPQTVAKWKLTAYHLRSYLSGIVPRLELRPLTSPVVVDAAGGTAAGWVIFDLGAHGGMVGEEPDQPGDWSSVRGFPDPVTILFLDALKADGTPAGNVGWSRDSTRTSYTQNNVTLSSYRLSRSFDLPGRYDTRGAGKLPRMAVYTGSGYVAATVGFTTAGTRLELDGLTSSSEIEMAGLGEEPAESSIQYLVSADGATYLEYQDGDVIGRGALAALPEQAFYYVRATLTPGAGGTVTPVLRELGARAIRRVDLDGVASVATNGWAIDPITLRAEIATATITVVRDGERDYRDIATELVALHYTKNLLFRIWIGGSDLPRAFWLHVDTFLIDDYDSSGASIRFECLSTLATLRTSLPVPRPDPDDPGHTLRAPLEVSGLTLGEAYAEILDGQVGLAGRYRGEGIPSEIVHTVTKSIEQSDAKMELDGLAYLAGGAMIASQGRIKFVDVFGARPAIATFPAEEILVESATPGLRQRVPEFFVPYSWVAEEDRYLQEGRFFHGPSLVNVGSMGLDAPRQLEDEIAKWIHTTELASEVGNRTVQKLGSGLILWPFRSIYAHPYLEPGDVVAIHTDRFVARDPNTGFELRGALWAIAVVQEVADVLGHEFTAWIRGYADIFPAEEPITRVGYTAGIEYTLPGFLRRRQTHDAVIVGWDRWGSKISEIRIFVVTVPEPELADSWPDITGNPTAVLTDRSVLEYELPVPPPGYITLAFVVPLTSDGRQGEIYPITVQPTADAPDVITGLQVAVNDSDGSVAIRIEVGPRTRSIRYAIQVGLNPGWPSDLQVESGPVVVPIAGVASITLGAGTVGLNGRIRVRAAPYYQEEGTGVGGATDHGEIRNGEDMRLPPPVSLEPTLVQEVGGTGTYGVTVRDAGGFATGLHVRTKAGEAAWTAWALVTATPTSGVQYSQAVALVEKHQSAVEFRLEYSTNGASGHVQAVSPNFDRGAIPDGVLVPFLDRRAATASAYAIGDADTVSWKIAASTAAHPSAATVRASAAISGRTLTPSTIANLLTGLVAGQTVYLAGFPIGPNGEEGSELVKAQAQVDVVAPGLAVSSESETGTTGAFGVTVRDPAAVATGLYYRTKSGAAPWGEWTLKTGTPADSGVFVETVTLEEDHLSFIEWRLDYSLIGDAQSIPLKSSGFDRGKVPDTAVSLRVDAIGNVTADLQGDYDTQSHRVAVSTLGYPSEATTRAAGVIAGRSATTTTLATIGVGTTVYASVFAYSDAAGGGTEASAMQRASITRMAFVAPKITEELSRSGSTTTLTVLIEDALKRLTAIEWKESLQGAAYGAFSPFWNSSTGTPGVDATLSRSLVRTVDGGKDVLVTYRATFIDENGNSRTISNTVSLSNLSGLTKTLRIPHTELVPNSEGASWNYEIGALNPGAPAVSSLYVGSSVLPKGVTLTKFSARLHRATASDTALAKLCKVTDDAVVTEIASVSHSSTGWQTVQATLSQLVGGEAYVWYVELESAGQAEDSKVMWCELEYAAPDYSKTY